MTEEQKQDLNPLIIKIKGISCLPSQPVPIDELEVRMSQMNWLESSFPSHCPMTCHGLSPSWPSRRWTIIPTSPFRISQWDMKEIGFLGLGATKSWGLPWVFFKWEQWSCLWTEPYTPLLQQLVLNQPGLALLLVLEAPFPSLGGHSVPGFSVFLLLCLLPGYAGAHPLVSSWEKVQWWEIRLCFFTLRIHVFDVFLNSPSWSSLFLPSCCCICHGVLKHQLAIC